jgi:small nuclear ribonucleoprotein (snRNP)-like protein
MNKNILKIPYVAVKEDWNLLQQFLKMKGNPRYIIVGDVDLHSRQDISDLGNLVGVEGYLNLFNSHIESLGELEYVAGDLTLYDCYYIKTLGKLKKVDGFFNLFNSHIESLGELEYVGDDLNLELCKKIKALGKLKKVDRSLYVSESSIKSLGELEYVGNNLWIRNANIPPHELNNVEVVGNIYR